MNKAIVPRQKMGLWGRLKRYMMMHNLPMIIMGGGAVIGHTKLTAQKYLVDWDALARHFKDLANFERYATKWAYIESLLAGDLELAGFVNSLRTIDPTGYRRVRNRLITTAFVDFVVDQLQAETSEFGDFKFHQCGLGTTNENITDTAIETDTGITPVAGTQTETDHDTYKSVATMTMDATEAITEHVLMSQSGAGTCFDRTEFAVINVVSGNQIEFTFEGSFTAGG